MIGVYVHIPFCRHRCPFCDFYTLPQGQDDGHESYTLNILKEIDLFPSFPFSNKTILDTFFFGGGTPSLIHPKHLEKIILHLNKKLSFSKEIEISIEVNPEDITDEKALHWKTIGINRINVGVQSFFPKELQRLERDVDETKTFKGFEILKKHFNNIGIDLMFGLEHQTLNAWEKNLAAAVSTNPTHISTYNLTLEENTPYAKEHKNKTLILPSDDIQAAQYLLAVDFLKSVDFKHYEISNFCKPGFESKHNLKYWTHQDYWGLGVSAHSYSSSTQSRWWNPKNMHTYAQKLALGSVPLQETEHLTQDQQWMEHILSGLRAIEGLDLLKLQALFPEKLSQFQKKIQKLIQSEHVYIENDTLKLTRKSLPIANEITAQLAI